MRLGNLGFGVTLGVLVAASALFAESNPPGSYPTAGLAPSQRPVGAPAITTFAKDGAWYGLALSGVDAPYPASLRFLEDQGAWFNPFMHAGMTGIYDLRQWHKSE